MIVAHLITPYLRRAVLLAAGSEEDVVFDPELALDAAERGFPRLVVAEGDFSGVVGLVDVPVVELTPALIGRWELERREFELPLPRVDFVADRLGALLGRSDDLPSWVDRTLADLSRAAGAQLPTALRSFGRRVMEFPGRYTGLRALAAVSGVSRGALKARFRRRRLESPAAYLRWFRLIAVAQVLSDRNVTISRAAYRTGFTSGGNLCRVISAVTGMTPTELRTAQGRSRLLLGFAGSHLTGEAIEGWARLDNLFEVTAA